MAVWLFGGPVNPLHPPPSLLKTALARLGIVDPFRRAFREIEFETTAYCNRKCVYCPNARYERRGAGPDKGMLLATFEHLVEQLVDLKFSGRVSPHLYGEPLADPRLPEWMAILRKRLPGCTIKIITNGDFLDQRTYWSLMASGVDHISISKHSPQLADHTERLLASLSHEERNLRISVVDFAADFRSSQSMFTNRGGEVALRVPKRPPYCCRYVVYPVVDSRGDVILCCQDYHSRYVFGNINARPLGDIWRDPKNLAVRRRIFRRLLDLPICRACQMV